MPIREKGYESWQGELSRNRLAWLPILRNGIRAVAKKKHSRLLFVMTALPALIFLVAIYASTKPELKMFRELIPVLRNDFTLFDGFYGNGFLMTMLMLLTIFSGADLVAGDLKSRAFALYFSRPLSRGEYLLGKFSIVLFYLLLFTLAPGILLIVFKLIFMGTISVSPHLLLAVVLFPVVLTIGLAAFTMLISTFTANSRLAQIGIFMIFLFSDGLANMLRHLFREDHFMLLSIRHNIVQISKFMFGLPGESGARPALSLLVFLGMAALFTLILDRRIRKAEAAI